MRLFIATSFPESVLFELDERVRRVKTKLPPASWVRRETQHLTFAFLGEQDESVIARLDPLVTNALAPVRQFQAQLRGCGFFPNTRRARVGWAGVTPGEKFIGIADAVRAAVKETGIQLDGAEFKPHLTLCRIRDSWPPGCVEIFNAAFGSLETEPFTVDHVTLYSSRLNPSGAVHTPVRQFALA